MQIQDRSPQSRPVASRNQSQTQLTRPVLDLQRALDVTLPRTSSWLTTDRKWRVWQFALLTWRCPSENLSIGGIQLQAVGLHPFCYFVNTGLAVVVQGYTTLSRNATKFGHFMFYLFLYCLVIGSSVSNLAHVHRAHVVP